MSGATERPWRVAKWVGRYYIVTADGEQAIAEVTPVGAHYDEVVDANADLIVRAVNAHEEAIGLLREAIDALLDGASTHDLGMELDERLSALLSRLDAGGTP